MIPLNVALTGESGELTETFDIGPTRYVRHQPWAGLGPIAEACATAGMSPIVVPYGPLAAGLDDPDVWFLSDLSRPAAALFGTLDRLRASVPRISGLIMVGGYFSFCGLDGLGGWQDPSSASLLPVVMAPDSDAVQMPEGVRLEPTPDCPRDLAIILKAAPTFFGYNRVDPGEGSIVLARFAGMSPALVCSGEGRRRTVAFMSDLLPHWALSISSWDRFPDLMRALCVLAAEGL
jgi:uncharacterized membrane protein